MSSCMSAWPCRPTPMQPKRIVSLGAVRAQTGGGTRAGAEAATAAAFKKLRRFMRASRLTLTRVMAAVNGEPGLFTNRGGPRCEARGVKLYSLVLRIPENEADGAGSFRPQGKNAL